MRKSNKSQFKLKPDWMLRRPLDFEYNKFILLNYIQKCENGFNNFEVYPDFVELSLHLANIHSIYKDKKVLTTNKKFDSCDDEILLKDLISIETQTFTELEEIELEKTIKYSGEKLYQMFNTAKSIWSIAFDNIEMTIRKNDSNLSSGYGYVFYLKKDTMMLYVWEYYDKRIKKNINNFKLHLNLIYEQPYTDKNIYDIIEENTRFNKNKNYKDFPIFEAKSFGYFPMENTFIPIIKRKLSSYLYQSVVLR